MEKKIEIGSKVSVKTKHYGIKTGTVIDFASGFAWWIIKLDDHPQQVAAVIEDIKIINKGENNQ